MSKHYTSHFHVVLKAARMERGWTQRQMAEFMETSQAHLCQLEGGDGVTLPVLRRWATALDMAVVLIEGDSDA